MKTVLNWEKGIFKNTYKIYSEKNLIGSLKENAWSQSADGELNGEEYHFKTTGFFNRETQIFSPQSENPVGKITYNSWKTKARIEFSGNDYSLSFDNLWNTKFSLQNQNGSIIRYHCSSSRGTIEYELQNNLLILAGLFINNYYLQTNVAIMLVIFLPIFTTILN